ncbi:MAG: TetR/AcrR family transcriptional regulator [Gemmataceae bacterium]
MRYGPEHKAQTRERILEAAARVFRRQGYAGTGIDAVMAEAGLTAGAFYAHFASKEALFAEIVPHALEQTSTLTGADFAELQGPDWARAVARRYLSKAHCNHVEKGCPLPPLLAEVSRSPAARQAFEQKLQELLVKVADKLPGKEEEMLALLSLLVGGMTLARAVEDENVATRILEACRQFIDTKCGR